MGCVSKGHLEVSCLDLECVLPQTIGSIVEGVLGWPHKAHLPAFGDQLHKPKTCQGNGLCSAGGTRGKSRYAVVKNWALEPDRSVLRLHLPSVIYETLGMSPKLYTPLSSSVK